MLQRVMTLPGVIDKLMNQGIFDYMVLPERLRDSGYSGGISILSCEGA